MPKRKLKSFLETINSNSLKVMNSNSKMSLKKMIPMVTEVKNSLKMINL